MGASKDGGGSKCCAVTACPLDPEPRPALGRMEHWCLGGSVASLLGQ